MRHGGKNTSPTPPRRDFISSQDSPGKSSSIINTHHVFPLLLTTQTFTGHAHLVFAVHCYFFSLFLYHHIVLLLSISPVRRTLIMPTPSRDPPNLIPELIAQSSCPPETSSRRLEETDGLLDQMQDDIPEVQQQQTSAGLQAPSPASNSAADNENKRMDIDYEATAPDMPSPMSPEGDKQDDSEIPAASSALLGSPSMGYDFSNVRVSQLLAVQLLCLLP